MKKFAWLLIAVLVQIICAADDDLVVKTANGPVKGHLVTSYNGRTAIAFEGIPFAKPPVGELRFKEPQPPEPWNDVLEANKKYTCLQYVSLEGEGGTSGDEDCLYLYVYVPRENINPDEKLDVAIHIHSGAFCSGDPHTWASYEYIMDKDLIYVTLNYRLGSLGFLSTQDSVVPGNNGLKDQALAMRWVKRNIRNFGGNPDAITLTGFSAGGSSVHLHYLSPWSTGLFVRGMSHSGTALNVYSLVKNPLQKAQKLGALFNCTTASSKEMVDCLRSKPVKDVARAHGHFYAFINLLPVVPFGPVIEYGVRFPFLPDHPYRLIAEGRINDVPWVSSNTKNEGIAPVGFIYLHDKLKELDRRWEELAPVVLEFNDTANEIDKTLIARAVRQHYFGNDSVSINNGQNLIDLYTERLYIADNIKAIVAHAKVAKSPVYYYRFDYFLENPVFYKGNLSGVPHGEDARVLYRQGDISLKLAAADSRMKDILVNFLYDYAHTGIPTFKGNTWDPLYSTSNPTSYLRIFSPDTIRKERALDLEGFNFWNQFPLFENEKVLPYLPRGEY